MNSTILTSSNAETYDDIPPTVRQYKFVYYIVYTKLPLTPLGVLDLYR